MNGKVKLDLKQEEDELMLNIEEQTRYALIDSLLDSYNENMALFRLFGDFVYQERAEHFMGMLKSHFKGETVEE